MSDQAPPMRVVYHATWMVEVPAHPDGPEATIAQLDPIGPGMTGRLIQMSLQRRLEQVYGDGANGVRVGAVSVTSERESWTARWEPQKPGKTGPPLAMIPLPSGQVGPGRGGGCAPDG